MARAVDLVTAFDVFQTLPDAVEHSAIVEIARVLKPGGWITQARQEEEQTIAAVRAWWKQAAEKPFAQWRNLP